MLREEALDGVIRCGMIKAGDMIRMKDAG